MMCPGTKGDIRKSYLEAKLRNNEVAMATGNGNRHRRPAKQEWSWFVFDWLKSFYFVLTRERIGVTRLIYVQLQG